MTCPYCGGEMERGYIHKGGYIAWNPDERDLGLRLLPLEAAGGRVTALLAFAYSRAL